MSIDLNCDLAEGTGVESEIIPWITSANIACGYHAGDSALMRETVRLCRKHGVSIGAHPSFPDRENFGRTNMHLPPEEVFRIVVEQLNILVEIVRSEAAALRHVKPHGALYNMAAADVVLARAIADAVFSIDPKLVLFGLSGSVMADAAAQAGISMAHEVFADRTYRSDGTLTPRSDPRALITDTEEACTRALALARSEPIDAVDGSRLNLRADTICLHGDGSHAVEFARSIRTALTGSGMVIQPITRGEA